MDEKVKGCRVSIYFDLDFETIAEKTGDIEENVREVWDDGGLEDYLEGFNLTASDLLKMSEHEWLSDIDIGSGYF